MERFKKILGAISFAYLFIYGTMYLIMIIVLILGGIK